MYICVYVYIYTHTCVCIYVYINIYCMYMYINIRDEILSGIFFKLNTVYLPLIFHTNSHF